MRRTAGRPFPLPSVGWSPPLPCTHTRNLSDGPPDPDETDSAAHSLGSRADSGANSPSDCGARPVQSVAGLAMDRRLPTPPNDMASVLEASFARTGNNGEVVQDRIDRGDDVASAPIHLRAAMVRVRRRTLASPAAVDGRSQGDLRSAQDRHCTPRGSRLRRSGRATRGDTPRLRERCRADQMDQRQDRSATATRPMSAA